ncbi:MULTISPECIES: hypothetical protein [unclassified Bradyrhizobium]|uniref:hypothetical protein n=1 Tax=unclassified Bradyrhizobium TaxID=2631580 RepID=UPI0020B21CCF|nr:MULTISPECIES: hypothetical protein [unclassified Bradyrhizobium]MCP3380620.1 hypothetical protein [Bradyrhizobium sp. CCGUVB4N]MCP3441488.1 hypothetical protein [Bradyrhizobium sp. CCGUVB14]
MSAWYRQISKLQPYAALAASSAVKANGEPLWPFDPERAMYAVIKYRIDFVRGLSTHFLA